MLLEKHTDKQTHVNTGLSHPQVLVEYRVGGVAFDAGFSFTLA